MARSKRSMKMQKLYEKTEDDVSMCDGCARENTGYCAICKDGDCYVTEDQLSEQEWMCDLMCGCPEED